MPSLWSCLHRSACRKTDDGDVGDSSLSLPPDRVHFSHKLVGSFPITTFATNYKKCVVDWVALLRRTALPKGTPSSDPRVIYAFKYIDSILSRRGTTLLRRLAYIQLIRLFIFLEASLKLERTRGIAHRRPGCRDVSVAMDIYMSAQIQQSKGLRYMLKERKRLGKRWTELSRPSPLFVLLYSNFAESIMY
ncbi:hypothetical protein V8F33_006093 [Rhypophila sp. PSN 637]